MADELDPALENADRAAELLAAQAKENLRPEVSASREAELDEAFAESQKNPPPDDKTDLGLENGGVRRSLEGAPSAADEAAAKAAEQKAADDAAAAKVLSDEKAAKDSTQPEKKTSLLDDLLAKPDATAEPAKDPFADVKLRSDASPKTRETFEQLKTIAKQREDAALAQASEAKTKLTELEAKVSELEKRTVPDEVKTELQELRAFRAQFDTANDPEFRQKFDSRITTNYEAVYGKLRAHGLPEKEVEILKGYDQATRDTAIDNFLSKLPSFDRKFIEAKLFDNVNVGDERERALQDARKKADEILASRKAAPAQEVARRDSEIATILKPAVQKLDWLHQKEIPSTAAPEDKKRLEAWNSFAASSVDALRNAIVNDTPQARAEAAIAVPLALYFRREFAAATARATAAEAKLDSITKAAQTSRTARGAGDRSTTPPKPVVTNQSPEDALDELFAQATGAKV